MSLNGNRRLTGTLRGFDQFMNIVLENAVEDKGKQGKFNIPDMVVSRFYFLCVREHVCVRAAFLSTLTAILFVGDSRQQHFDAGALC